MSASTLKYLLVVGLALLLPAGCALAGPVSGPAATATQTPTASLTPEPLALSVNGTGISRAEFEAELARYRQDQAELGISAGADAAAQAVLDSLIDTLLLVQGAAENGYTVEDDALQARIEALAAQIGGPQALTAWQAAHGYTEQEFRSDLRRQMAAAWMRERIVAQIGPTAAQVHVKQILLYNEEGAQTVLAQLQAGWDFPELAATYDPQTNGELGWIPAGYLAEQVVEQAVFALQPGEYSGVVVTQAGYHIFYVVESDPQRPLSPDARIVLQERALAEWLQARRETSTILIGQ
jgi:peptidyl-prolyl cis-trans isomerase C